MRSLSLVPRMTVPTRITNESQTLLDNILISKLYTHTSGVLTFEVSVYFPVLINLKGVFNSVNRKEMIRYPETVPQQFISQGFQISNG